MKPTYTQLLFLLAAGLGLSSCTTTSAFVEVKNSRTGAPIGGAAVVSVNGTTRSSPNYTDAKGLAPLPALPVPVREINVTKSGYTTATIPLPAGAP